jgi:hypothetical protein
MIELGDEGFTIGWSFRREKGSCFLLGHLLDQNYMLGDSRL